MEGSVGVRTLDPEIAIGNTMERGVDVGLEVKSMVLSRGGVLRSNPSSDASPSLWMGMIIGI